MIEIGEYGVTDFAAPNAPATFDLLLREPGRFPITDGDNGRIVGRLVVHKPAEHDNGDGGGGKKGDGGRGDGGKHGGADRDHAQDQAAETT